MGRPRIEIDLAEVERLAAEGHTMEGIAINLGVHVDTLYARKKEYSGFSDAIKRGQEKCHTAVSAKLRELCEAGNLGAIIWYEKTRRGMRETQDINLNRADLSKLSDDELEALAAGKGSGGIGAAPTPRSNGHAAPVDPEG